MSASPHVFAVTAGDPTMEFYLGRLAHGSVQLTLAESVADLAKRLASSDDALILLVLRTVAVQHEEDYLHRLLDARPELRERTILIGDRRGLEFAIPCRLPDPPSFSALEAAIQDLAVPRARPEAIDRLPNPAGRRLLAHAANLSRHYDQREQVWRQGLELLLEASGASSGAVVTLSGEGRQDFAVAARTGVAFPKAGRETLHEAYLQLARQALARRVVQRGIDSRPHIASELLAAPLLDRRKTPMGAVLLVAPPGERFLNDCLPLVGTLADLYAMQVECAQRLEEAERLAVVDPLTGLYNRRFFDRTIDVELQRAVRFGRPLTLSLIDLDHFKSINDELGYAEGDRVIRRVASLLRQNFREVDYVMRWGGDEFAVLLPDTGGAGGDSGAIHALLERIRSRVRNADFEGFDPPPGISLSLSIGAATYPRDAGDAQELFARANEALHEAKRRGRNRIVLAEELSRDRAQEA